MAIRVFVLETKMVGLTVHPIVEGRCPSGHWDHHDAAGDASGRAPHEAGSVPS